MSRAIPTLRPLSSRSVLVCPVVCWPPDSHVAAAPICSFPRADVSVSLLLSASARYQSASRWFYNIPGGICAVRAGTTPACTTRKADIPCTAPSNTPCARAAVVPCSAAEVAPCTRTALIARTTAVSRIMCSSRAHPCMVLNPRPIDVSDVLPSLQQCLVEAFPNAGMLPIPQAAPAGHPTVAAQLLGQHLPGKATLEDEEDAGERGAIRNAGTPALGLGTLHRQERRNQCPQRVTGQLRTRA